MGFLFDVQSAIQQKKLAILESKDLYWKRLAEEKKLDLEIKQQTLQEKKKKTQLAHESIRHLELKNNILRHRFLRERERNPLSSSQEDESVDTLNKTL